MIQNKKECMYTKENMTVKGKLHKIVKIKVFKWKKVPVTKKWKTRTNGN